MHGNIGGRPKSPLGRITAISRRLRHKGGFWDRKGRRRKKRGIFGPLTEKTKTYANGGMYYVNS